MFDGTGYGPEYPDHIILGMECCNCGWPVVTLYTKPENAPRAIYGPTCDDYTYEELAFEAIRDAPGPSIELEPSDHRDGDWSRGCVAAKGQFQ